MRSNNNERTLVKRTVGAFAVCVLVLGACHGARARSRQAGAAGGDAVLAGTLQRHRAHRRADRRHALPASSWNRSSGRQRRRDDCSPRARGVGESGRPALSRRAGGADGDLRGAARRSGRGSMRLFGDLFLTGNARVGGAHHRADAEEARYFAGVVVAEPLGPAFREGQHHQGDRPERDGRADQRPRRQAQPARHPYRLGSVEQVLHRGGDTTCGNWTRAKVRRRGHPTAGQETWTEGSWNCSHGREAAARRTSSPRAATATSTASRGNDL